MKIAVLGTGSAGRTIATRLSELGHEVVVGTRDPEATAARTEWADQSLRLAAYSDAAAGSDLVVNVTNGNASLDVLSLAGADNLAGKVVVDVSNPLDFSQGFPPTLFVKAPTRWPSRSSAPSPTRWS